MKLQRGVIVTLTGPSGAGKTSILREWMRVDPSIEVVPSYTTRAPRDSDVLGEYVYVSEKEFKSLEMGNEFLWTANVHGNSYGTTISDIDAALAIPKTSAMILVPNVLEVLRAYTNRVVCYFITTGSKSVLKKRLKSRGETKKEIKRRIKDSKNWEKEARKSDIPYIFLKNNKPIEQTVKAFRTDLLWENSKIKNL